MATEKSVVVSCLSLNFSTLIKLSWSVLVWTLQTEQGTVILPTLLLASVAFCLPVLWYCLFPLLAFFSLHRSVSEFSFALLESATCYCFLQPHMLPLTLYVHWNFVIFRTSLPIPLLCFAISEHYFRSCSHPAWNEFCWQKDTAALLNVLKLSEITW